MAKGKPRKIVCCFCRAKRPSHWLYLGWTGIHIYGRGQVSHWACQQCDAIHDLSAHAAKALDDKTVCAAAWEAKKRD